MLAFNSCTRSATTRFSSYTVCVQKENEYLAKLVLSQFCWRGASPETIHSLIPRVKKVLLVDLQFSCVEDVIDEVGISYPFFLQLCGNLAEPDDTITYSAMSPRSLLCT